MVEDLANQHTFDTFTWGRYKRMYENGAQDIYPYNAVNNPEVIDTALRAGRKVYFVSPGIFQGVDEIACQFLCSRYDVKVIGRWFHDSTLPAASREAAKHFLFSQVVAIADPDYQLEQATNCVVARPFAISHDGRLLPF
jgi:hypothetical protein